MTQALSLPVLFIGLYMLSSVIFKKLRSNWAGTQICTGALSNLGMGIFFVYGALLLILVPLPFENFISALIFAIVPMVGAWFLAYKGYKIDAANHKEKQNEKNT